MRKKKESSSLGINVGEWMKTLDEERAHPRKVTPTEEQQEFIRYAREEGKAVPWTKMAVIWESMGWGSISKTTLRSLYHAYMDNGLDPGYTNDIQSAQPTL